VGWTGEAVLEGAVLAELAPLLAAIETVGVGRATTMGFGCITVEPIE
jgi:CRISPR/Cas system endoribonuclease Cas6 (RAMP superfamily)